MRIIVLLGAVLLGCWSMAVGGEGVPPGPTRSLVSRMLDAREKLKLPTRPMWFELDAEASSVDWPFDIVRIEGLLEKVLVRDAEGGYRLRRTQLEDANAARVEALAYVNRVISDWAVMQLDAAFPRVDEKALRALAAYREDLDKNFWNRMTLLTTKGVLNGQSDQKGGWIAGWKIAEKLYLVVSANLVDECQPRDYQFVMWDGVTDWPIVGFDEFPDAARARMVLRLMKAPAATNNLVALIHARDANRYTYSANYAELLLRRAAGGGSEAAFHNLGVLMEEKGDAEQAAAFYSREKSASMGN